MKRILCITVFAIVLLLSGCSGYTRQTTDNPSMPAIAAQANPGPKQSAKNFLADMKVRMSATVKDSYFKSKDWKAFVDSYWKGYNEGQKQMKNPEYITPEEITY